MSSRQRRVLVRRHKDAIIAWRVAARLNGWTEPTVSMYTDFQLAQMFHNEVPMPFTQVPFPVSTH